MLFAVTFRFMTTARTLIVIGVTILMLIFLQYQSGTVSVGSEWLDLLGGLPRTLFGFFLGVAIRRLRPRLPQISAPSIVVLVVAGLTFLPPLSGTTSRFWEIVAITLIFPALIHAGADAIERQPRLGALFGDLSYALYLVHFPILLLFVRGMYVVRVSPGWPLEVVYVAVCLQPHGALALFTIRSPLVDYQWS